MLKKLIFIFVLLVSNLLAENENRTFIYDKQSFQTPVDLEIKREYLKLYDKKQKIRNIKKRDVSIQKEFQEFNHLAISNTPKKLPFTPISFIEVHPHLPTSISFPENVLITFVDVQPRTVVPQFDFNLLDIKPTDNLLRTVLTLKYYLSSDPDKKVHTLKIHVNRYTQNYSNDKNLYTMFEYIKTEDISEIEILKSYLKLKKGELPKDGSSINIDNVEYRFVEDQVNGTIRIGNKKYLIQRGF
jgi:hypothetical protein